MVDPSAAGAEEAMERHVSRSFKAVLVGVLAAGALTATPSLALTYVRFTFTAGATPVHGRYTLDCPAGVGPCTIVAISGMFGSTPIVLAQPPFPGGTPDNLLNRPTYTPTAYGADFWPDPEPSPEDDRIWRLIAEQLRLEEYVKDQEAYVQQYLITDYQAIVPEPAAWLLLLVGFFGLGAGLRASRPVLRTAPVAVAGQSKVRR